MDRASIIRQLAQGLANRLSGTFPWGAGRPSLCGMGAQTTWGRRRVGARDVTERIGSISFVQSGCTIRHRLWPSLTDDWRARAGRVGVSKDSP